MSCQNRIADDGPVVQDAYADGVVCAPTPRDCASRPRDSRFDSLRRELDAAFAQAAVGKGMQRHGDDGAFEDQINVRIADELGASFPIGQAVKKLIEGNRMARNGDAQAALREFHGAIVYAAMACIVTRDR